MERINLEYPRSDVKTLVKIAFDHTHGINRYYDKGSKITAKTGFRLGSWGERVIVDIPEDQPDTDGTNIFVMSERVVNMNITSHPQKFENRFISSLNSLRGKDVNQILEENQYFDNTNDATKEGTDSGKKNAGTFARVAIGFILALMALITIFLIAGALA